MSPLKTLTLKLKSNKLIKNSFIFFLGSFAVSVGNYIFHLLSGRLLGPEDYGVLASLISVSSILAIPAGTIALVSIKLTSKIKVNKNFGQLNFLIRSFLKYLSIAGIVIFLTIAVLSPFLANFLKIPSTKLIVLLGVLLFLSFLNPITQGALQGLQMFKPLAWIMATQPLVKVGLGIGLILAGFKVYGALGALIAASLVVLILSFKPLWFVFRYPAHNKIKFYKIISYAFPVFISLFCFALLYNIDIVLVKHFFASRDAGLYSALSKLGQIIFFGTGAIAAVIFPMVSEKHEKGEDHTSYLKQSLLIVFGVSAAAVAFYFLFPGFVIRMLFGKAYLAISPLVGLFGIAMLFLALDNILIRYFLSIHRFKFIYFLIFISILEIGLIVFYHQSINQVVVNLIISLCLLFLGLIIFYLQSVQKNKFKIEK